MVRGALPACIAGVLLAHGGLAWTLLHSAPSGEASPGVHARPALEVFTLKVAAAGAPPGPADRRVPSAAAAAGPQPAGEPVPKMVREPSGAPAPEIHGPAPVQLYKSPNELDRAALPLSSPDLDMLAGTTWSGLPLRLRLFIDAKGTVVDVRVLRSHEDPELLERIREMFLATGFIPGRLNGVDVPSYKELELSLRPLP